MERTIESLEKEAEEIRKAKEEKKGLERQTENEKRRFAMEIAGSDIKTVLDSLEETDRAYISESMLAAQKRAEEEMLVREKRKNEGFFRKLMRRI